MAKEPKGGTMEERWAEEDAQGAPGFNPTTGEPNVSDDEEIDLEAIEAELSDADENEDGDWSEIEPDASNT